MRHLMRDMRFGLRLLLTNPGFSAVTVLTLALVIRTYFANLLQADVEGEAARTAAIAQRVIEDLDTTASGVQSAIALEALVSAAFILINSKVGDLIGRKRAYVLGLLAYAVGALAMTLTQSLTTIVIFWAVIGGLGASLLLPAMQSLIHGNFSGAAQKQAYALIGAAAAIAIDSRQHNAGEADALVKGPSQIDRVLAGERVRDQQHFMRMGRGFDIGRLGHHLFVKGGAAGGVEQHDVVAA